MKDSPKRLWGCLVSVFGIGVAVIGLIYGMVFVGIPAQDPTPEMIREAAFHETVSGLMIRGGGILFLAGLVAFLGLFVAGIVADRGSRAD